MKEKIYNKAGIIVALVMLGVFCPFAHAAEWYVDDDAITEVADGTSSHPYPTIQAAVSRAGANDVIYVAEGVYSSGEEQIDGIRYARVHVSGKSGLKIMGAGRGESVIVGSRNPASSDFEDGKDRYVGCVYVEDKSSNVVIEGFTLRDGEAKPLLEAGGYGGGLYAPDQNAYLVDCDIVHCSAAFGGAMQGGTAVRCLLKDSYGNSGPATRTSRLINCVIVGSRSSVGSRAVFNDSTLYNCTAIDNGASKWTLQGTKGAAYNCIFALNSTASVLADEKDSNSVFTDCVAASTAAGGFMQVAGPAVGDYRPLAGSDAVAAGRLSHLSSLSLPIGIDALKDITGATIAANGDGRINAGAIQEAVSPAGGALVFQDGVYEVDGVTNTQSFFTWVYPDRYPTQYCVRAILPAGQHLQRLCRIDPATGEEKRYLPALVPYRDGSMWMMPPPDPAISATNLQLVAETVLYVDPNEGAGSDTTGDGSQGNPYATLQKAVDSASGRTIVYLKPGEYTNDVQVGANGRGFFRLYQTSNSSSVRIVSTDGAANTIIRGQPDPDFEDGKGSNAIKGLYLKKFTILQDVTIADCYTDSSSGTGAAQYGAAVYADSSTSDGPPQVIDCIITNCHAVNYVAVNYIVMRRCRIFDSSTDAYYAVGGSNAENSGMPVFSCYLRGVENRLANSSGNGLFGGNSRIYQTTVVGTPGSGRTTGRANVSYNSIWYGGKDIYSTSVFTNCLVYGLDGDAQGVYAKGDPFISDISLSGSLCTNSPALGAGGVPSADNFGTDFWKVACGDIDGKPLAFDAEGHPTLGAFQTPDPMARVTVQEPVGGGWAFEDGREFDDINLGESEAISVVAAAGTRPCIGVRCNGTDYIFTNGQTSATIPYAIAVNGTNGLSGIYTTDWYVDERNGSDGNSGFWRTAAKKTLADAVAALASGDTLWVLPGVYTNGATLHDSRYTIKSRVVVTNGVSVRSTDGPQSTFIVGAPATIDPDDYGCGANAVRCAYVGQNSQLSGFTLTGGRVNLANGNSYDSFGAAVLGYDGGRGCVVENCVISNNVSFLGTAARCDLFSCRVMGNTVMDRASGLHKGNAFGSYFYGNRGPSVLAYPQLIWNCTVARENWRLTGDSLSASLGNAVDGSLYANSFFGSSVSTGASEVRMDHVVMHNGTIGANTVTNVVIIADSSGQEFADGVPVIGANVCVDAGDASLNTNALGAVDLNGCARVRNGRMDIGCFEADWCGKYSQKLSGRKSFAVVAADSQVVLEEGADLTIRSGMLAAEWTNTAERTRTYGCGVEVTGSGVLSVTLNGEAFATLARTDGAQRLEFSNDAATNSLVFTYTPSEDDGGWAILKEFSFQGGGFVMTLK